MPGGIPICLYEPELGKFRVIRSKGKALSSGGYGVTWSHASIVTAKISSSLASCSDAFKSSPTSFTCSMINCSDRGKKSCTNDIGGRSTEIEKESDTKSPHTSDRGVDVSSGTTGADGREPSSVTPQFTGADASKDASTKKNSKNNATATATAEYLFIEEVLFLHERGLIQALQRIHSNGRTGNSNSGNCTSTSKEVVLDTQALYEIMLHQLHMPLLIYLTYSHLRSQTFIVLRHTATRYGLLERLQSAAFTSTAPSKEAKRKRKIGEQEQKSKDVFLQTQTQDNCNNTDYVTKTSRSDTQNETKTKGETELKIDLSSSANKGVQNEVYDEKKRKLDQNMGVSIWMRQKLEHPKMQLRRDIFEAPIPPVIHSIGPTAATENDMEVVKRGDVIDETVMEEDHRMQYPFENDDAVNAEKNKLVPLHRIDHNRDAIAFKNSTDDDSDLIAFDVYNPNSQFRKTNPGIPDFYVAVTSYDEPSLPHSELLALIRSCRGVPLRMAAVADGGTVVMFGLTDFGAPSIA